MQGIKVAPALRIGLTVLGILIVIGAFAGVTAAGALNNKPPLRVAVTARDVAPGERLSLSDVRIVDQGIDPTLAKLYVQEYELDKYVGAVALDQLRRGDPLNKVKLAGDSNEAVTRRYALALKDPNDVIMVLPVTPDIIPPAVTKGDMLNINLVVGSNTSINQMPGQDTQNGGSGGGAVRAPAAAAGKTITLTGAGTPGIGGDVNAGSAMTAEIPVSLSLPVADLLLERVPVLDAVHEQIQNVTSASSVNDSNGNAPEFVDGAIKAVVVRVPARLQTLLNFAATTGKLRFAIASPNAANASGKPSGVVDWQGMADLLHWKQEQSLMSGESLTRTIYPNYVPPTAPTVLPPPSAPQPLPTPAPAAPAPVPGGDTGSTSSGGTSGATNGTSPTSPTTSGTTPGAPPGAPGSAASAASTPAAGTQASQGGSGGQ